MHSHKPEKRNPHSTILVRVSSPSGDPLYRDAENDYTFPMRGTLYGVALVGLSCVLTPPLVLGDKSAGDKSAHALYDALNALRVDPATTYPIEVANRIEIRRADLKLSFEEGKLAFLAALDGHTSGAVFSGIGHALALPHGVVEKQQMARFLGAPVLDQDFTFVLLRFTDNTADELLRQFSSAKLQPQQNTEFAARWTSLLVSSNPMHSLRIASESLTKDPRPYFYATIGGIATGPFDAVLDLQRSEPVLLGQSKAAGTQSFYDVWCSYQIPEVSPPDRTFRALRYAIDASIFTDSSLDGKTDVRIHAEKSGERYLVFQLSRTLGVISITGEQGEALAFFQNEGMNLQERNLRGSDYVYVVLPAAPPQGAEFTLRFHYRGRVIENAGNGVLFVSARESWYPHLGGTADFADYDLTMRWPRHLRLVATGVKSDEHEEGDFHIGHWRTEKPASVAGFNLGDYLSSSITSQPYSIDIFANRELEQAIDNRLQTPPQFPNIASLGPEGRTSGNRLEMAPPPPRPADALKQLGREIEASIRFYETFSGPFPYQKLSVSQIPGSFGQGWPGLLYLSTYSYLPAQAQQRAGLSLANQENFTELIPSHEVAHQWWGNIVGWNSYRDQWIDESIANYLALLFLDTQKGVHPLRIWLDRYRRHLAEVPQGSDQYICDIGALELGSRLTSSKSPTGFEDVIYTKGAWVVHMLHELLRQPGTKDPDARFNTLLHTLATKYAYRGLSTADLQREVEAVMTPSMELEGGHSMDWFFEQWVRGTGIPRYRVDFGVHHNDKGYLVRGRLFQQGVPHSFIAPVPLYATSAGSRSTLLGTVVAAGPETSFHFTTQIEPQKILIDPQMTLLCIPQ
jgi:Peptidase family M1 domain